MGYRYKKTYYSAQKNGRLWIKLTVSRNLLLVFSPFLHKFLQPCGQNSSIDIFPVHTPHHRVGAALAAAPCISKNRRGDSGIARRRNAAVFPMPMASVGDRKGRPYAFSRNSPHARRILRVGAALAAAPVSQKTVGAIHESPADLQ